MSASVSIHFREWSESDLDIEDWSRKYPKAKEGGKRHVSQGYETHPYPSIYDSMSLHSRLLKWPVLV
jgi:hypothetical protein